MARMTMESIEAKIKKAEDRVIKTGETYNLACEELKELRKKKAAIENDILVEAFMKSNKTLEDALEFFRSDMKEESEEDKPKRRGRRKRVADEG